MRARVRTQCRCTVIELHDRAPERYVYACHRLRHHTCLGKHARTCYIISSFAITGALAGVHITPPSPDDLSHRKPIPCLVSLTS
eukprot:324424-Pelagomonas_calceolata.AAC.5